MKISDERLEELIDKVSVSSLPLYGLDALAAFRELQQYREELTWKRVADGINPELDVFLINMSNHSDLSCVHVALKVGESYKIDSIDCPRDDVYFGQWDIEDILKEYPDATWRDIVGVVN